MRIRYCWVLGWPKFISGVVCFFGRRHPFNWMRGHNLSTVLAPASDAYCISAGACDGGKQSDGNCWSAASSFAAVIQGYVYSFPSCAPRITRSTSNIASRSFLTRQPYVQGSANSFLVEAPEELEYCEACGYGSAGTSSRP